MAGRPVVPVRHWLIQAKIDKGLTYLQLAKEVGVTQQAIFLWERGKRTPKPKFAKKIASVLGLDWTKFYESKEKEE